MNLRKIIFATKKKISTFRHRPPRIAIELTNRCNLNCPFCLVGMQNELDDVSHHKLPREFGSMNIELGEKILKEAKAFGISEIMLTFQGEPLLHPEFTKFVRLCRKYTMSPVLFTNGLLLNLEYSSEIIEAGLDSIRFSVDGASQETYGKNRVGGEFEKVYQNMADFIKVAKKLNPSLKAAWQFIVLRNNEHEVEKAEKMASNIGIPIIFKTFAESVPELSPENPKFKRKVQYKPCKDIYRCPAVLWTGELVPCCYDVAGKEIMGNLKKNTFREIWNSQKYKEFREIVDRMPVTAEKEPELCRNCLKWETLGKK